MREKATHMQLVLCSVDRNGQVVDSQPVAVGIRIGECARLQDLVIGEQHSCNIMHRLGPCVILLLENNFSNAFRMMGVCKML